jgi:hypothetical protein
MTCTAALRDGLRLHVVRQGTNIMTIYAKSFIALDGNQRFTGATTAQIYPYDHYFCHLCGSALVFHPEWAPTVRGLNTHGKT